MNQRVMRMTRAVILLAASVALASPVFAASHLFWGLQGRDQQTPTMANPQLVGMVPSSSPGILELNPTASGASFTVPEGVFTNQFSFSFAWPSGGYVYGYGKPERKNLQLGPFQANALTPSATITLNATNSNYPYLSGTPHEAFIRMKVGSKGRNSAGSGRVMRLNFLCPSRAPMMDTMPLTCPSRTPASPSRTTLPGSDRYRKL